MESNTTDESPGDETDQGIQREPAQTDDESLPDPFREEGQEHLRANEFVLIPHHPVHILNGFLSIPPIHGLRDLARTLWYRRRNAFYPVLLRRFWGSHPWTMLFLTVVALSFAVVPIGYGVMLSAYLLAQRADPSGAFPFPLRVSVLYSLVPSFLYNPSLYLAALCAWKIRRFNLAQGFDSELAVLPNWKPFVLRALAVQLCGAAILLTFVGDRAFTVVGMLRSSFRAAIFPPGTPPIRWVTHFLGLSPHPDLLEIIRFQVLGQVNECCYQIIVMSLWMIAVLRARTLLRMIGYAFLVGYLSIWYAKILTWLAGEVASFTTLTPSHGFAGAVATPLFKLAVHLLVIGTIWHVAYRRVCREDDAPVPDR